MKRNLTLNPYLIYLIYLLYTPHRGAGGLLSPLYPPPGGRGASYSLALYALYSTPPASSFLGIARK